MSHYDIYAIGNALVDSEYEVTDAQLQSMGVDKRHMTLIDTPRRAELLSHVKAITPRQTGGGSAGNTVVALAQLGGQASLRMRDGQALVTDNGQHILDVRGLSITHPLAFEDQVSQWPGVVTVGVFAHQKADVCLLGTPSGVKTLTY
jgi:ribose 5-phosphate isomerase